MRKTPMRTTLMVSMVVMAALVALPGCDALGSALSAESTCEDFNEASPQDQSIIVGALVQAAEGGARNPLREANAVMQISYVCGQPGKGSTALGEIAI